jgi:hypothetical protein
MTDERVGLAVEIVERRRPVIEFGGERAGRHLLEADRERAIDGAGAHRLPRKKECRGSGRAIVVHVDDGNAGHADPIERFLPRGRIAVHVTGECLLHVAIVEARFGKRVGDCARRHHVVGFARAGLGERDHADTGDDDIATHGSSGIELFRRCASASIRGPGRS